MRTLAIAAALVAAGWTVVAMAGEVRVKFEDLPAAVRASVQKHYPSAQRLGFSREREHGRLMFEAELNNDGHHVDASFDSLGVLKLEETTIPWHEVPQPVRTSLAASRHAGGSVTRSERIVELGSKHPPRYELAIREGDLRSELEYDSSGRLVHEEKIGRED